MGRQPVDSHYLAGQRGELALKGRLIQNRWCLWMEYTALPVMLLTVGHPSVAMNTSGVGQNEGLWPSMVLTQGSFDPQDSCISSDLALGRADKML